MATEKKTGKILLSEKETREGLLRGAKASATAVGMSYGAKGRNFLLEKGFGRPILTRDGVTISRDVYFSDRILNMGAQMILEAAETTNRIAGDGTSATSVLSYYLFKNGVQFINSGVHPMEVAETLKQDSIKMLSKLKYLTSPVKDNQLKDVATVSVGDPLIGQLIAEAIHHVGDNGGIITEKSMINDVERVYEDGYYLQSGFQSLQAGKKELTDPYVVVSSKRITSGADAIELLTKVAKLNNLQPGDIPRVLFVGEFEDMAYQTIIDGVNRGVIDAVVIKTPPQFGDMGKHLLEDIAILAGCDPITDNTALKVFNKNYIGSVNKVVASKSESTLFADNESETVLDRIQELRDQLEDEISDGVKESLRDRIAKLEGKIAIFKIGGTTDTIKEELEFRIEDAINATRHAYIEGIVAGGGVTLLELSKLDISDMTKNALQSTFKKLLENANLPAELKLDEAMKAKVGFGFNTRANDGKLVDMVKSGIIDPSLVVRETIKNATSTVAANLTVGGALIFADEE